MRTYLPRYQVLNPGSLEEALEAMASGERIIPLAGGTDLMVYLEAGNLPPCTFVNLDALEEFRSPGPFIEDNQLVLGPLATYLEARTSPQVRRHVPMLVQAAREVGVPAVQSRGTWVGNIVNASPAADGVPALMCYDAELELTSRRGSRRLPLAEFYRGYKQTALEAGELITSVRLETPSPGWHEYYRKVGTRRFQAISKTLLAARILLDAGKVRDVRLVLASVAPFTLRARRTEDLLRGSLLNAETVEEAVLSLQQEITPIDDVRSTVEYRRRVSGNLIRDFLSTVLNHQAP